jgi:predicted nucleotidyltransferase
VFKWPDRETVLAAAGRWALMVRAQDPSVREVLCVGSYARGDWGVGSDLDVIVVVTESALSPARR